MAATNYTPIQHYRTSTADAEPNAANLVAGELAINTTDVAVYAKNTGGTVKRIMNNPAGLKYPTADGSANQVIKTDGAGGLSFDSFQAPITGAATTIATADLTASRALVSDSSGKVAVSTTTSTEIGYISGVTSSVQTQLDGKAAQKGTASVYGGAKFSLSGSTLTITTT